MELRCPLVCMDIAYYKLVQQSACSLEVLVHSVEAAQTLIEMKFFGTIGKQSSGQRYFDFLSTYSIHLLLGSTIANLYTFSFFIFQYISGNPRSIWHSEQSCNVPISVQILYEEKTIFNGKSCISCMYLILGTSIQDASRQLTFRKLLHLRGHFID